MLSTVKLAMQVYANQAIWLKIVKNGMSKDFSWEASARKYIQLYKKLMA
jgi:starch synthase